MYLDREMLKVVKEATGDDRVVDAYEAVKLFHAASGGPCASFCPRTSSLTLPWPSSRKLWPAMAQVSSCTPTLSINRSRVLRGALHMRCQSSFESNGSPAVTCSDRVVLLLESDRRKSSC